MDVGRRDAGREPVSPSPPGGSVVLQPQGWLASGQHVEVQMQEDGLHGSLYAARVLEVRQKKALLEFAAFCVEMPDGADGDAPLLQEWVSTGLLSPQPPPTPPGFPEQLPVGKLLQLLHDDGWWDVRLLETRRNETSSHVEYHVHSERYKRTSWVGADVLRPLWKFNGTRWRADAVGTIAAAPAKPREGGQKRRRRCGECSGCLADSCGECHFCKDMLKFGGQGTLRQPCLKRACHALIEATRVAKAAESAATAAATAVAEAVTAAAAAEALSVDSRAFRLNPRPSTCARDETVGSSSAGGASSPWAVPPAHRPSHPVSASLPADELVRWGESLLHTQLRREGGFWFAEPVDLAQAPDYSLLISRPLDLRTVRDKLRKGEYATDVSAFAADVRTIYVNAMTYNWSPDNQCHVAARSGLTAFEEALELKLAAAHGGRDSAGGTPPQKRPRGGRDRPATDAAAHDALCDYVTRCGGDAGMVARWSARIFDRSDDAKITGTYCVFYSEDDRPFRSKAEVARFLGLDSHGGSQRAVVESTLPGAEGSEAVELPQTVPDELLDGMPALTGAEAPGPRPDTSDPADVLCSLPAEAAGVLLRITDFLRALGPSLRLPPCAGPRALAELLCASSGAQGVGGRRLAASQAGAAADACAPGGHGDPQAVAAPRLAMLHVRLLQVLLGDSTAPSWWAQANSMEEHVLGKPVPVAAADETAVSALAGAAADADCGPSGVGETETAEEGPEVWEPAHVVETKLWEGAATAGWRMRLRSVAGRKACWAYVAPSGAVARTKEEANGMRESEEHRATQVEEAAWVRQRVAHGMGREELVGWRVSAPMTVPAQRVRKPALREPKLPPHAPTPSVQPQAPQLLQVPPQLSPVQLGGGCGEAAPQPDVVQGQDQAGVGGAGAGGGGCGAPCSPVCGAPLTVDAAPCAAAVSPNSADGGLRVGRPVLGNGTFMVEALLGYRRRTVGAGAVEEWLVKWDGFSPANNSWEPFEHLSEGLRPQALKLKLEQGTGPMAGPAAGPSIERLCSGWVLGFDPATALHQIALDGDTCVTVRAPLRPDSHDLQLLYSIAPPTLRHGGGAPRPSTTDVSLASWPALAAAAVVRLSHAGCGGQREPLDDSQPLAGGIPRAAADAGASALAAGAAAPPAPRSFAVPAPLELCASGGPSPEPTPLSPEASTSLSDAGRGAAECAEGEPGSKDAGAGSQPPASARRRSSRMAARPATNWRDGARSKVANSQAGGGRGGAGTWLDVEASLLRAPLEDGVRSLLAATPAGLAAAYHYLPPVAKLALLSELVHAVAETATVAFAADAQYRLMVDEEAEEPERRRQQRSDCELLRAAVLDHIELRKKRGGQKGPRKSLLPTTVAEARVAGLVATLVEEAVLPPPALVLSRQELSAAELAEGMELELLAAPLDSTGRHRTPILIERAAARRDEARRRRETLHRPRAEAQAALVSGISRRSREALLSALELAHGALLAGDSASDGVGPRRWESSGGACRWMTSEVRDAYATLAELALEQGYKAEALRRRRAVGALHLRTTCLGRDRWGRRHWVLPWCGLEDLPGRNGQGGGRAGGVSQSDGEATPAAPESDADPLVWVEPAAAALAVRSSRPPPDVPLGRERAWQLFRGRLASEQLAASLDARGRYERALQAELRGL